MAQTASTPIKTDMKLRLIIVFLFSFSLVLLNVVVRQEPSDNHACSSGERCYLSAYVAASSDLCVGHGGILIARLPKGRDIDAMLVADQSGDADRG